MFRSNYQFFKRLTGTTRAFIGLKTTFNSQVPLSFSLIRPNKVSFQTPLSTFNFSSSSHVNTYIEDLKQVPNPFVSGPIFEKVQEAMNKYATGKDLELLQPVDIRLISLVLGNLSHCYWQKDKEKAWKYMKEAEDFNNKLGVKDTYEVALCQFMLGLGYRDLQDYTKAKDYFENVERICKLIDEKKEADIHVQTGVIGLKIHAWSYLGSVYLSLNQDEKALEVCNSVLTNIENVSVDERLDILIMTYQSLQKIAAKKKDVEKEKEYRTNEIGLTILNNHNLAENFSRIGNFTEAIPYATEALRLAFQVYPEESVIVGYCYLFLGRLYKFSNDSTKALESAEKAIKIFEKLPESQENSRYKNDSYLLAAEAQGMNQAANNHSKTSAKADDLSVAEGYMNQVYQLHGQGAYKEAETLCRRLLKSMKRENL